MTVVQCDRCGKTASVRVDIANPQSPAVTLKKPDGWTKPSLNFERRDLCPDCSAVLKTVFEAFLSNGAVPQPRPTPTREGYELDMRRVGDDRRPADRGPAR